MNSIETSSSRTDARCEDGDSKQWNGLNDYLLIILLWAAVYLPGLGRLEFHLEEPHRVEPAIEMLDSGNWTQPTIGGEPYYRKPPMINWLIAIAFKCAGGISELAARLPCVLSMLALALAARMMFADLAGRNAALGAAIVVLTCSATMDKGRICEIEGIYTALTGIAMLIWLRGWARGSVSWMSWMIIGLFLGLAALTKGPLHLLFFYGFVLLLSLPDRRWRELLMLRHLAGFIFMCLVVGSWLWSARAALGEAKSTWSGEMTDRFATASQAINWSEIFINPIRSALNFAPWIFLALVRPWRNSRNSQAGPLHRFLRWTPWYILLVVLILPAFPGYRPRYSMPGYGAVLLCLGAWGEGVVLTSRAGWLWRALILFAAAMAIPAAVVSIWLNHGEWIWSLCSVAAITLGLFVFWRQRALANSRMRWQFSALALAALALAGWGIATPLLLRKSIHKPAAAAVAAQLRQDEKFIAYRPGHLSFMIYLHGRFNFVADEKQIPDGPVKVLTRGIEVPLELTNRAPRVLAKVGQRASTGILMQLEARDSRSVK